MSNEPAESASKVPREIVWLGIVSFLTDVSSEAIFAILPLYFVQVLGGSPILMGLMEGGADFAASSLNLLSGYVSDKTGKRKWIAWSGYAFSTLAKLLLLVVTTASGVVFFRVLERLGKSIRGAPRDALLSAIAPKKKRGASFGLHKAMDKAGAVLGPLIAYGVIAGVGASMSGFRIIFWGALIPAVIAIVVLAVFVREHSAPVRRMPAVRVVLSSLQPRYWWYMAAAFVFSLGYFSWAFLLLKARSVGFRVEDQALLYALFHIVFVVVSIPAGKLSDRLGRQRVVVASYLLYGLISVFFMISSNIFSVIALFAIYGVFMAIDESQTKAWIADLVRDDFRATALGVYGLVTGAAYLPASLIAGVLWSYHPSAMFGFAVITTGLALLILFLGNRFSRLAPAEQA